MADKQRQRRHGQQQGNGGRAGRHEAQQRTRRAMEAAATAKDATDAMRRGVEGAGRGQRDATVETIEQAQHVGRSAIEAAGTYGRAMENASHKAQAMAECSRAVADGIPAAQRALMEWMT